SNVIPKAISEIFYVFFGITIKNVSMPGMLSRTCVSLACEANRFCLRGSARCSPLHSNAVGSKRLRTPLSDARNRLYTIGTERTAATCYGSRMRYFNAREITRPEAQHIR